MGVFTCFYWNASLTTLTSSILLSLESNHYKCCNVTLKAWWKIQCSYMQTNKIIKNSLLLLIYFCIYSKTKRKSVCLLVIKYLLVRHWLCKHYRWMFSLKEIFLHLECVWSCGAAVVRIARRGRTTEVGITDNH